MRELAEDQIGNEKLREAALGAIDTLDVERVHFALLVDGDVDGLLKLVTGNVAVQAVAKLLQALGMEAEDAKEAAKALAPTNDQMERLDDEGLAVLGELVGGVPQHIQEKVLTAALTKLLIGLHLPEALASDVAQAIHLDPQQLIPCLTEPAQLPSVLKEWAESTSFDASLAALTKSVEKLLRELVEEHVNKEKLRKAALGAVDSLDFTREHFELLVAGQLAGLLKLVMVDAAAGAIDALTAGLQQKVDKAMDTAMKVEQVAGLVSGVVDTITGGDMGADLMELLGELGTVGKLAKSVYELAKGAKVHQKECDVFKRKVERTERLLEKARRLEGIVASVREVERILSEAVVFIEKSQQQGFLLRTLKAKRGKVRLAELGEELKTAMDELNLDATLSAAVAPWPSPEETSSAARQDETALQTLSERVAAADENEPMEKLAEGLPFDASFLQDEIGGHMDELKQSLGELLMGQNKIMDQNEEIKDEVKEIRDHQKEAEDSLTKPKVYLHVAVQGVPVVFGQASAEPQVRAIEAEFERIRGNLTAGRKFPIFLSDASSSHAHVMTQLEDGRVNALVWCAKGDGWEDREEKLPSLDKVVKLIEENEDMRRQVVVVCLQYGAERAAMRLFDVGVQSVVWLTADMLQPESASVFDIATGAVDRLIANEDPADISARILEAMAASGAADIDLGACGCASKGSLTPWKTKVAEEHWLENLTEKPPGCDIDPQSNLFKDLQLLACDLGSVQKLRDALPCTTKQLPCDNSCMMVSCGVAGTTGRRRAVTLAVVTAHIGSGSSYGYVCYVSSADQMREASKAIGGLAGKVALLWLDLADMTEGMLTEIAEIWRSHKLAGSAHVIFTCDDSGLAEADANTGKGGDDSDDSDESDDSDDDNCTKWFSAFQEALGFEDILLGQETGEADVHADELHDEFKLCARFDGEPSPLSLLDVFEEDDLRIAIRAQMQGKPVVAIYRSDDRSGVFVRVCLSDVGFLHKLRDELLTGTFAHGLAVTLKDEEKADYKDLGDLTISVDKTQFAERYEASVLNLNKLTPHQRLKLEECLSTDDADGMQVAEPGVHVKAPAGAGKTFVALHLMLSMLEHRKGSTVTELDGVKFADGRGLTIKRRRKVLFIAKNRPLAMFVTKWLAHRVKGAKSREFVLKNLHVLFAPFEEGPRRYAKQSYAQSRLEFEAVDKTPTYDLVVIDEAHHVFKDDVLRAAVAPYLEPSKTRCMLLSDVSQSLRSDIEFPEGLHPVHLTEVVRSSKRIVAGAMQFQTDAKTEGDQGAALETKCHHESEGPPLKSFLFDVKDGQDQFKIYAEQTLSAIQQVTGEFEGLSLHDRFALIVPNAEFRASLLPGLNDQLRKAYTDRKFKLVTAEEASGLMGSGSEGAKQVDGAEWIMLDEIGQLDGLERLIVVGVGLDSAKDDTASDNVETRLMLYRAMARAH
eukprot:SAG25_NODE_1010_length_4313_cov_1.562411_1_plen_1437_part_11